MFFKYNIWIIIKENSNMPETFGNFDIPQMNTTEKVDNTCNRTHFGSRIKVKIKVYEMRGLQELKNG